MQALAKIHEHNPLPAICGRICTAPCETAGVRDQENAFLSIRALERYAADFGKPRFAIKKTVARTGKKVAIIGSGPAGLSAAADLAQGGYRVTVFEALDHPGGILHYGIPAFRLPPKILDEAIQEIKLLGVEIKTSCYAGKTFALTDLFIQGFEAILLATGAGIPQLQDIDGANLGGVYYGEELLMRVNLAGRVGPVSRDRQSSLFFQDNNFQLGNRVVVLGSSFMALDCARAAVRLDKQVTWVSPQPSDDKKNLPEEIAYAEKEGVCIEALARPLAIMGNDQHCVRAIQCVRLDYADEHAQGEWELIPVPDSGFTIEADSVIIAMGQEPNSLIRRDTPQLKINKNGTIWINPGNSMTSLAGVFACGSVVIHASPLVEAIALGKKAAIDIEKYFNNSRAH